MSDNDEDLKDLLRQHKAEMLNVRQQLALVSTQLSDVLARLERLAPLER